MSFKYILVFSLSLLILFACNQKEEPKVKRISQKEKAQKEEMLQKANKGMLKIYRERVNSFASRRQWKLTETETGFWYQIYQEGEGPKVSTGDNVSLKYTLMLLDGTICYTSDSTGLKSFKVGQGGVEAGLEEAVVMLREGDKARVVIPPYKAWGVPGDGDKIPALSIIAYIIEVVKVVQ